MSHEVPRLSVVVTVVDGGDTLLRCLGALAEQREPPSLEVLVPFDPYAEGAAIARERFPRVMFVDLGKPSTERPAESPAGQHELFDRRRAAGLAAARGELVAILEDRSVPAQDWARAVDRLHALPHAVIGGAVANGIDRTLSWAVFFCDFGRYQPPFEPGPRAWATDVNVSYKRAALERTRELWRERYHETTVHWALRRAGETLFLDPSMRVVQERRGLRLGPLLSERFHWGRLFAYTRAREGTAGRRLLYALGSPLLPFVLLARVLRGRIGRRGLGRFVVAAPAVLLLLVAWSAGEAVGYLTGRA